MDVSKLIFLPILGVLLEVLSIRLSQVGQKTGCQDHTRPVGQPFRNRPSLETEAEIKRFSYLAGGVGMKQHQEPTSGAFQVGKVEIELQETAGAGQMTKLQKGFCWGPSEYLPLLSGL